FRLKGKKLKGEFVLARMRSRRPGSKGTEWLLIKKRDEAAKEGFDANDPKFDFSVLTKRSMADIGGDEEARRWKSNRPAASTKSPGPGKNAWLADAIRKYDRKKSRSTTEGTENTEKGKTRSKSKLKSSPTRAP